MSYTPTEWKAGDTVTSAKLNKIEQGIANTILFVHETYTVETIGGESCEVYTLDKTWAEIYAADLVIIIYDNVKALVTTLNASAFTVETDSTSYQANSENDYPKYIYGLK